MNGASSQKRGLVLWTTLLALAAFALVSAPAMSGGGVDGPDPLGASSGMASDPIRISTTTAQKGIRVGGIADLALILRMEDGWHVNSNQPREEWLIPTEIFLDSTTVVEIVEVVYPEDHLLTFEFSEEPMAVYENGSPIGIRIRLLEGPEEPRLELTGVLSYQACNDETCLPPTEKEFSAVFDVVGENQSVQRTETSIFTSIPFGDGNVDQVTAAAIATSPAEPASESEGGFKARLVGALERNFSNPLIAILITLFAGLASAATPCVYPMISITARILMGRGGENPALGRLHAFAYFLGIILVYALLGFAAGLTGGAFNEILRIPLVILSFAILFALLGLSMLGLFEIQIPAGLASRVDSSTSSRTGVIGTMLMGVGAGLIVSPCVGPVVIFILTQIAAQIANVEAAGGGSLSTTGQVFYGSFLMAGYGAGLGVPFLLVGLFSARMAKPGPWMTAIRMALGVVILYFAWDYFHKALATAGVERGIANAILTGVVLVFLSVFWGVFRTKTDGPHWGWERVRLGSTIIMMIVGVFFLWTGLNRSGIVGPPMGYSSGPAGSAADSGMEDSHGLVWHRSFTEASARAQAEKLPMFVDFYAHWCANCKVFSKQAADPGALRTALETVVLAKVYDTDEIFDTFRNDPRFPELKRGLPFFLLLSSSGEYLWKGTDYRAHETMIEQIRRAREQELGDLSIGGGF